MRSNAAPVLTTLQALAEPNRLRIVELLRRGPRPVGAIGERLELLQPQVSKHLAVLKSAGLVDVEPRANQRVYQLRGAPLAELEGWLQQYRELWEERFTQLDDVLEDMQQHQHQHHQQQQKQKQKQKQRQSTHTKERRHGRHPHKDKHPR